MRDFFVDCLLTYYLPVPLLPPNVSPMTSRTTATLGRQELPSLPALEGKGLDKGTSQAVKRIQGDSDLQSWQASYAHRTLVLFLARLCENAVGKGSRFWKRSAYHTAECKIDAVERILLLLDELQDWTKEIEPLQSPQRFGNLAFRIWGGRLEEMSTSLHLNLLPPNLHGLIPELETYLLGGFGSWVRLDYGSGHELSFLAWLCFLTRAGFFQMGASEPLIDPETETRLAVEVIPKYLMVVWGVQDRYGLEPAGSHGVWGLDDYHFIPYAIGAAQLRDQSAYPPSAITLPSHKPDVARMPNDQVLQFIPSATTATSSRTFTTRNDPPFANLYTSSITRIHSLKKGPFSEHSPILYDIAMTVPNWVKVHGGMMKMWEAECLNKRPVVQHFPFGFVCFIWEGSTSSGNEGGGTSVTEMLAAKKDGGVMMPPTVAPWKQAGGASSQPVTTAPLRRPLPSGLGSMASTGSAAAASSPFGIISRPSIPFRSKKE